MPVQSFTTLNDPSATQVLTAAFGINAAGQIVGEYAAGNRDHGFSRADIALQ